MDELRKVAQGKQEFNDMVKQGKSLQELNDAVADVRKDNYIALFVAYEICMAYLKTDYLARLEFPLDQRQDYTEQYFVQKIFKDKLTTIKGETLNLQDARILDVSTSKTGQGRFRELIGQDAQSSMITALYA